MAIYVNNILVTPTVFPDGTKQVWKLGNILKPLNDIEWVYEDDSELITLAQLVTLIRKGNNTTTSLYMPYLPYARQDKQPSNDTTFGLHSFAMLINSLCIHTIKFYDVHSFKAVELIRNSQNIYPKHINEKLYDNNTYSLVIYPDKGASERYTTNITYVVGEKIRDQATGKIVSYSIPHLKNKNMSNVLVVDDLCDGGATFLMVLEAVKKENPDAFLHLVVSHVVQKNAILKLLLAGYGSVSCKYNNYYVVKINNIPTLVTIKREGKNETTSNVIV